MERLTACILAGLVAAGSVAAQTVTLDMENVTLEQVLGELRAQTGYDIRLMNPGAMGQPEPVIERVQAADRPLKEVLREVCVWTGCRYRRDYGNTFRIEPGLFEESFSATTVAGYRISVEHVFVNEGARTLDLVREYEGARLQPPSLRLNMALEAPTDEAASAVGGFERMRAVDDQGREATMDERQEQMMLQQYLQFNQVPDRATFDLNFQDFGLHANALERLEGTLLLYENVEELEFRFDDLSAHDATVKHGDVAVTLQEATVRAGQVHVSRRVDAPRAQGGMDSRWAGGKIEVVFEDGTTESVPTYFQVGSGTHGMGLREREKKPVAIVFRVVRRGGPMKKLPFVIEDIPLPN